MLEVLCHAVAPDSRPYEQAATARWDMPAPLEGQKHRVHACECCVSAGACGCGFNRRPLYVRAGAWDRCGKRCRVCCPVGSVQTAPTPPRGRNAKALRSMGRRGKREPFVAHNQRPTTDHALARRLYVLNNLNCNNAQSTLSTFAGDGRTIRLRQLRRYTTCRTTHTTCCAAPIPVAVPRRCQWPRCRHE